MYEKNNDKENLLDNEEECDNEQNQLVNKNEKNNKSFTSLNVKKDSNLVHDVKKSKATENNHHQPAFLLRQKGCKENKICKFLVCCFYESYDLTIEENELYKQFCKEYGLEYNERVEEHEYHLNEIVILCDKIFEETKWTWRELGFQVS